MLHSVKERHAAGIVSANKHYTEACKLYKDRLMKLRRVFEVYNKRVERPTKSWADGNSLIKAANDMGDIIDFMTVR